MRGSPQSLDRDTAGEVSFYVKEFYSTYFNFFFYNLFRREEAASRPKMEYVPKTLADLSVDLPSDSMNGGNFSLYGKTHFTFETIRSERWRC